MHWSINTGNVFKTKRTLILNRKLLKIILENKFVRASFLIVVIFENLCYTW